MTKADNIALLTGSGTLANEVVAAQIKRIGGEGIVISNGEFGERLVAQARRFSIKFHHLKYAWGEAFDYWQIVELLKTKKYSWVWFCHLETSTGILNDLVRVSDSCEKFGAKLCVDAISSIGNVDANFRKVYLASASSGKGLAAIAGVAIVFSSHIPTPDESLQAI